MSDDLNQVIQREKEFRESVHKRALDLEKMYVELEQSQEAALNIMEDLDEQSRALQQEVAERRAAEEKLRNAYREVELLANLVENAHEMVFVLQSEGKIMKFNALARSVFGYSQAEILTQNIKKLFKFGIDKKWETIADAVRRESHWRGYLTAVCKDRREFHAYVTISRPLSGGGEDENGKMICFIRDVSEEKEIERLKNEFISTVSHELRTPLSITREGISLILDKIPGKINKKQEELLTTAMGNIDRLARIINDLLDISKIEAGKLELRRGMVNISGLMKKLIASFMPKIKSKGLDLKVSYPKKEVYGFIDEDKIFQVFANLIGNSIKFTEKGYIELLAREKENEIECIVADTGIGISKKDMTKLFSKFQQFERTAGPGGRGTGLGLSIAKSLVDMHGGAIEVESILNKGTVFTLRLPKYTTWNILKEQIQTRMREADANATSLSLLSVNLLNFKEHKKKIGKEKADKLFKILTSEVKKLLRQTGDVLVEAHRNIFVLLPETDKKGAIIVLDRIKQAFENYIRIERIRELKELKIDFRSVTYPDEAKDYNDMVEKNLVG